MFLTERCKMLFLNFFENEITLVIGFMLLAFLFVMTKTAAPLKFAKGLWYVFFAFLIFFTAAYFYEEYAFFMFQGVSAPILTFLRLFLSIVATALLLMASYDILLQKDLPVYILSLFVSLGLLVSFYAVFIANSQDMGQNICFVVPLIGFVNLFLSFSAQPDLKKQSGFWLASVSVFGIVLGIGSEIWKGVEFPLALSVFFLMGLGTSYLMMLAETYNKTQLMTTERLNKIQDNMYGVMKSSPFPVLIVRLKDDQIIFANQNALKLFELDGSELARYHFKEFFVDDNNQKLLLEKLERAKEVQDFEILIKTFLGTSPFWVTVSANVIEYKDELTLYLAFQDITARKQHEKALQNKADRDPLTLIYNRGYFETNIPQKIKISHLAKQSFAVLMIDADHFKKVNDTYGHKIGDKVLMEMAHVIERSLRPDDVVARYGGEEFVVFLNNVKPDIAVLVAERLKNSVAGAVVYSDKGEPVTWTVSIGVASSGISDDVGVMIKMADDAMYLAKKNGRNRVEQYEVSRMDILKNNRHRQTAVHPALLTKEDEEISLLDGADMNFMSEK